MQMLAGRVRPMCPIIHQHRPPYSIPIHIITPHRAFQSASSPRHQKRALRRRTRMEWTRNWPPGCCSMRCRADQWSSTYGLGPIHSSIPSMGSGSMASTAPQSNSGSSMEDVYRGMGMETTPDRSGGQYEHQPQGVLRQQEQQVLSYPFVLDNDTEAIWSTAPTGVQCVISILLVCNVIHPLSLFSLTEGISGVHTSRTSVN